VLGRVRWGGGGCGAGGGGGGGGGAQTLFSVSELRTILLAK